MPTFARVEVYRALHAKLSAAAMRMVGDATTAEDIASEALARAWTRLSSFATEDQLGAWTWCVARNLSVDAIRARSRTMPLDGVGELADAQSDATTPFEHEEERRFVRAAFARLNERHQELLYLRDVQEVPYEQLARRMGTSEQGVRQAIVRARRGLRDSLRAVAGGAFGVFLWLRARLRAASIAPPVALEAVAALVIGVGLVIGGMTTPFRDAVDVASVDARPTSDVSVATVGGGVKTGVSHGPTDGGPPSRIVSASIDRDSGSARFESRLPTPLGEEYVWARVWRDQQEAPSEVLTTLDDVSEVACSNVRSGCDTLDETLRNGLGG